MNPYEYIIIAASSSGLSLRDFANNVRHWGLYILDPNGNHAFTFETGVCVYCNTSTEDTASLANELATATANEIAKIDTDPNLSPKDKETLKEAITNIKYSVSVENGFYCEKDGKIVEKFEKPANSASYDFNSYDWKHPDKDFASIKPLASGKLTEAFTERSIAEALVEATSDLGPQNNPCQRGLAEFLARWAEGGDQFFKDQASFSQVNARLLNQLLLEGNCLDKGTENIETLAQENATGHADPIEHDDPTDPETPTDPITPIEPNDPADHDDPMHTEGGL